MEKTDFVQITRRPRIPEAEFYPAIYAMSEEIWRQLLPPQFLTKGMSVKRKHNVITPPEKPIPDCVTCGACCDAMPCVGVRPGEEERLTADDYWEITTPGLNDEIIVDRYLRRDGETLRCKFLDISDDYKATCRIYERRPQMCHDFEAGSDKCHALRRAYGIEPFLSSEEMTAASKRLENRPKAAVLSEIIGEAKFVETAPGEISINAHLNDGTTRVIHKFSAGSEVYMQFEFDALTLDEAAKLIGKRAAAFNGE